jgi:hypothetical protein
MKTVKGNPLALAIIGCALSILSTVAVGQTGYGPEINDGYGGGGGQANSGSSTAGVNSQVYVQQPNDGYAEGQTIYIDSQGGKYVLLPDGRTRVSPMPKIDGCDVGLRWAPVTGIYWCPTYTSNPDPVIVTPPTPTTYTPPVFPPDVQPPVTSAWTTFTPVSSGGDTGTSVVTFIPGCGTDCGGGGGGGGSSGGNYSGGANWGTGSGGTWGSASGEVAGTNGEAGSE